MLYVIINAILYIYLFLFYWKKKKILDFGNIILALYMIIACTCVVTIANEIQYFKLDFWPFIYLFICLFLASRYFHYNEFFAKDFKIKNLKLSKLFVVVMFFASAINLYYSLGSTVMLVVNDDIKDMYNNKDSIETSVNIIDWFAKNLLTYLSIPFSIIIFYLYKTSSIKQSYLYLIIFFIFSVSLILVSAMRALRWNMLHDMFVCISGYILFYKTIDNSKKNFVNLGFCILATCLVAYFVIIAVARHSIGSDYDDSNSSLIFYLGHSMLVFNYGIVDTIHTFANGNYFLGLKLPNTGIHSNGDFSTLVGNLYIDFGFIITFCICYLSYYLFKWIKNVDNVANAYIVINFFVFLAMGGFVHPYGYGLNFIFSIFFYIILKLLF